MGDGWTVLGRLHVATVHFPIALIVAGVAVDLLNRSRDPGRERTASTMIALGALSSVVAAALGWIHDAAEPMGGSLSVIVERHRWFGIGSTVLAALAATLRRSVAIRRALGIMAVAAVAIAGHLGGELTYGEGWFLEPLRDAESSDAQAAAAPPVTADSASSELEFARDVLPVFENRCVACHGETKQKGDLRLDRIEAHWFEESELGTIPVVRGDPARSELVRRLELPLDDDDHMPPAKKPQPSADEVATIRRWIEQGAR
jgi:uncharacterized membrane protein